jgi:hypothetical protein
MRTRDGLLTVKKYPLGRFADKKGCECSVSRYATLLASISGNFALTWLIDLASKYRDSLDLYTVSLNKNPFDAIVWSNREPVKHICKDNRCLTWCKLSGAAVRLKLEEHGLAIADASWCFNLSTAPPLRLLSIDVNCSEGHRVGQEICESLSLSLWNSCAGL